MSGASLKRGKKAGRSIKEKIMAETGTPLTHTVIKATDSSAHPPKSKHIEALIRFSFNPAIDDAEMIAELLERSRLKSWIPVLKAMVCWHRLMRDGKLEFLRLFCNQPGPLNLLGFQDHSSPEGPSVATFIQGYSTYMNLKARYLLKEGFDYCHAGSTAAGDSLSTAEPPQLFQRLDLILHQMKTILSFTSDSHATAIFGNLVVKEAASLLFKDILRLWICANNATVNILEHFFTFPMKDAKEGLRLYENFVKLCNHTDKFVETCSMIGANNGKQIPTLGEAPKILLPKLREHVKSGRPSAAAAATPGKQQAAAPAVDPFDPRSQGKGSASPAADPFDPRGVAAAATVSPSHHFAADGAAMPALDASVNPENPFL